MLTDESRAPERPMVRRYFGRATLAAAGLLIVMLVVTRRIEWRLVTLAAFLWGVWSFVGGLYTRLIEPAGRFLANQFTGNLPSLERPETIDEQTMRLERMLQQGTTPHHEMMIGIRLAEIYRTHQKDLAKSDALLARLRAKYPNAPELTHAGPH